MSDVSVGHFDEQVGCKGNYHSLGEWRHLVSYQVAQSRTRGHSDVIVGLVPTRSYMSASPSITMSRMCSHLDGCKCRAFPQMIVGVSYHADGCECYAFSQMIVGVSYHVGEYKCWAFLTCMLYVFLAWSDVSAEPF